MNILFSLSKTLRVEGLEILEKEAMGFSSESSMDEEEEEEEEGEDLYTEGSRSPENIRVCRVWRNKRHGEYKMIGAS